MTPRDWVVLVGREDHAIPRDDLVEHAASRACACGPDVVEIDGRGGPCWQVTHHSLDGREVDW